MVVYFSRKRPFGVHLVTTSHKKATVSQPGARLVKSFNGLLRLTAAILAAPRLVLGGGMPSNHAVPALAGQAAFNSMVAESCIVCDETEPVRSASTGELVGYEEQRQFNEFHSVWRERERRLPTGSDCVRLWHGSRRRGTTRAGSPRLSSGEQTGAEP